MKNKISKEVRRIILSGTGAHSISELVERRYPDVKNYSNSFNRVTTKKQFKRLMNESR